MECEKFIYSLRRRIFEEGKGDDTEWITSFIGSCFAQDALRWYTELSPEIQGHPTRLEKAMLDQYPPPADRGRTVKTGATRVVYPASPSVHNHLQNTVSAQGGHIDVSAKRSKHASAGSSSTASVKVLRVLS